MLVLVVMFATLNQLHFSIRFPYDNHGPTKGAYLQFAGPLFCALAALGIAWLWNRRHPITRLLAVVGMARDRAVGQLQRLREDHRPSLGVIRAGRRLLQGLPLSLTLL